MSTGKLLIYIAIMMLVTYALRALPLLLFRKEIKSVFVRSFLHYVPYAVLGAMTFPAILYSTGSVMTAAAGLAVGLVLSFMEKSLLTVAIFSCVAVFAAQWIVTLI